jgi:hypothetical protein
MNLARQTSRRDQPAPAGGTKALLLTLAFATGLLCFAFAAKLRLIDRVAHAEDVVWWFVGIVIYLFAGIAASRAKHSTPEWAMAHPSVVRFWTACGALGVVLFGLVITGISVLGLLEQDRPHRGEGAIAILMAFVGLAVVGWGAFEARGLWRPIGRVTADAARGAPSRSASTTRPPAPTEALPLSPAPDKSGVERETVVGVFVERPERQKGEVFLFCFYEDGVVLLGRASQAKATQEALAAWDRGSRTRPVEGFAHEGTYRRNGTRVLFSFVIMKNRTLNFDWDDEGYYEEDQFIVEYSGTITQDRLTLDWTSGWDAETFVAPPPVRGRLECERVTA